MARILHRAPRGDALAPSGIRCSPSIARSSSPPSQARAAFRGIGPRRRSRSFADHRSLRCTRNEAGEIVEVHVLTESGRRGIPWLVLDPARKRGHVRRRGFLRRWTRRGRHDVRRRAARGEDDLRGVARFEPQGVRRVKLPGLEPSQVRSRALDRAPGESAHRASGNAHRWSFLDASSHHSRTSPLA